MSTPSLIAPSPIETLPYLADMGSRLRHLCSADSRPVWLRLGKGRQELFAAWPESLLRLENGLLRNYSNSGTLLDEGIRQELWHLIERGLPSTETRSKSPFQGGWLGILGYNLDTDTEGPPHFPAALLGNYRRFIWIDHDRQQAELVTAEGCSGHHDDWLVLINASTSSSTNPPVPFRLTEGFTPLTSKERYSQDFEKIQSYLQAGDCYQVNYAQAFKAHCTGSGAAAMDRLLALSNPPHAGWMNSPDGEVLSLSPELFLSIRNRHVVTKPIKGTAPRGSAAAEDQENRTRLASSKKDQAENLMIVDLLRHDVGQHARTGSVKVDQLFAIESLPQVHHMISTISADLDEHSHPVDLIRDCFPGGSITGAPKKRAMEIISELEPFPRSVYCGSMGFITTHGDAQLNIAIRTLLRVGDTIYTWAGSGIVADSDCDAEYQECFDKMGALMRVLESNPES